MISGGSVGRSGGKLQARWGQLGVPRASSEGPTPTSVAMPREGHLCRGSAQTKDDDPHVFLLCISLPYPAGVTGSDAVAVVAVVVRASAALSAERARLHATALAGQRLDAPARSTQAVLVARRTPAVGTTRAPAAIRGAAVPWASSGCRRGVIIGALGCWWMGR